MDDANASRPGLSVLERVRNAAARKEQPNASQTSRKVEIALHGSVESMNPSKKRAARLHGSSYE